jgi:hypothetical protein
MIFARAINDPLTSLVKKLDAEVAKAGKTKMAAFIIFLMDDDGAQSKIKAFAKQHDLKHVSLALETNLAGPYKQDPIAPEAAATVILYSRRKVVVNLAFDSKSFTEAAVARVLAELPKIQKKG